MSSSVRRTSVLPSEMYRCIDMYACKWRHCLIPSSRPSAASCGNSEISIFFFPQFSGFLISCASPSLYILSPGPIPPPPTSSCHRRMPWLSASEGSMCCRLPQLSATLSSFLPLPVSTSCPEPFYFQRCLKNRLNNTRFLKVFYLICFYSHGLPGSATTQQGLWILFSFYSWRSILLASTATILPTPKQTRSPRTENVLLFSFPIISGLPSIWECSGYSIAFLSKIIFTASLLIPPPNEFSHTVVVACCCGNMKTNLFFFLLQMGVVNWWLCLLLSSWPVKRLDLCKRMFSPAWLLLLLQFMLSPCINSV